MPPVCFLSGIGLTARWPSFSIAHVLYHLLSGMETEKISFLYLQPVFVAAQPPRAVSRSSTGIPRPTLYMASAIYVKGITAGIPASAISAQISALEAPRALRL